eukprot:TRINITY_DN971_c0_g1_i4.p1 TRINITY_DN971_c0_g1~~TRINITY_DN971_c0_g1_i4.p1  ORF type:complete len:286 (-),score=105.77 TRINITY_DN971_c0_g1_i4:67-924(-)
MNTRTQQLLVLPMENSTDNSSLTNDLSSARDAHSTIEEQQLESTNTTNQAHPEPEIDVTQTNNVESSTDNNTMNPQDSSNAIQHDEVFRNTNSTSEETTSTVSTDSLSTRKGKGKGKAKASLSEQLSEDYGGQFDGVEVTDEDEDIELPDGMFVDDSLTELGSEDDEGNVEFKLYLKPSQSRFERLVTQMKFRLMEGSGEAIYEIGVEDNGHVHGLDDDELDSSIATLEAMAEQLAAEVTIIKRRKGDHGQSAVCMVRRLVAAGESCVDLRIAVAGNVDSVSDTH